MLGLSTAAKNAILNALRDQIDLGAGQGKLKIYSGARPLSAGGAITTQTLLATPLFSATSAPNASGGVLTFSAITSVAAVATGTATWARITDSDDNFVADVDVGPSSSTTAEVRLSSVLLVATGSVAITSGLISL